MIFKSMSVKLKIYLIAIVGLLGFGVYLSFNVVVNTDNANTLAEIRDKNYPALALAKSNRAQIERINENYSTAVIIGEIEYVDEANSLAEELLRSFERSKSLQPEDAGIIEKIQLSFKSYIEQVRAISIAMIESQVDFETLPEMASKKEELGSLRSRKSV